MDHPTKTLSYFTKPGGWFYKYVLLAWLAIAGVYLFVVWFHYALLIVILAFIILGWLQYVLVQAMHEAVHQYFLKKNFESLLVACLTTYPVGLTRNYLIIHFRHHWYFGDAENDPDSSGYANPPLSKLEFVLRLARVGLIVPAVIQFFQQNTSKQKANGRADALKYPPYKELLNLVLVQLVIFVTITYSLSAWAYVFLWLLPIVTVVKVLSFARIMAEHSSTSGAPVLRTFETSWWRGALLGPFGFQYHGAHHQQMTIPFDRLNEFRTWPSRTKETSHFRSENFKGCHQSYLWQWFKALPLRNTIPEKGAGRAE